MGGHPPPGKSDRKYPLLYFYNSPPEKWSNFSKSWRFIKKVVGFIKKWSVSGKSRRFPENLGDFRKTGHFFGKSSTFRENRSLLPKIGPFSLNGFENVAKITLFVKKAKEKEKEASGRNQHFYAGLSSCPHTTTILTYFSSTPSGLDKVKQNKQKTRITDKDYIKQTTTQST